MQADLSNSTQWTPSVTMDPRVHLRSTWRDAIGKLLTNGRITRYIKEGWYGQSMQQRALKDAKPHTGLVFRCGCGSTKGVTYRAYSYMAKPGYICEICLAHIRKERRLEQELHERVKAAEAKRIAEEYV